MFLAPIRFACVWQQPSSVGMGWGGGGQGDRKSARVEYKAMWLCLMACLHEHSKMLVKQYLLFPESLSGTELMYLILY